MERWFRTLKSECLKNEEYETPAQREAIVRRFVDDYKGVQAPPVPRLRHAVVVVLHGHSGGGVG